MKTTGRYEIREVLGEGGMGVVYRAFDPVMGREVTLKTIRNPQDKTSLDLFKRECQVLASMAHPNIVQIHDVGEVDEAGGKRPYFVMPLLRGVTLKQLIDSNGARLTTERSVHIMGQACRGLQAAHELGLVHRDLKPSNIFILEDDSVNIIDFGVAHLMAPGAATGLKGTLLYMAPEQLAMKPPTPLSDQFSIAVVCYEMLAHRHPFSVPGYKDLTEAILKHVQAPVCDVNPTVNRPVSQVIHKALAKEPFNRFANVREFADCLNKALRNEPIEFFDASKITPRLERAVKAMAAGDFTFASDILRELEAESYLDPEIGRLRREIDENRRRENIRGLLETAHRRFEDDEFLLALEKVQEVLNIDSGNAEAKTLKGEIENKRSMAQIEGSLKLARQHLENRAYALARQMLDRVLQLSPKDPRAHALIAETDRREQERARTRQEKEKAFQAAMQAFGAGEFSAAQTKLEKVLELDRRSTDSSLPEHQKLYEEVRLKREQIDARLAEAKRNVGEGELDAALAICDDVLKTYPNNVHFGSLRIDVEEAKRDQVSAFIAKVEKETGAEPDLDRKVALLETARLKYPQEERFRNSLERVKARRDLVRGIVGRATTLENSEQYAEALNQWEIIRNTYPQYPGLDFEIDRVKQRRQQQGLAEAKHQWVVQIDQALGLQNYANAASLADEALGEFTQDAELLTLKRNAQLGMKRAEDARLKLDEGQQLFKAGKSDEGFACLRDALNLDPQSQVARNALVDALLQRSRRLLDSDWHAADSLVNEAQDLDPGNPLAKSLQTLLQDRKESEQITSVLSKARESQARGDLKGAIAELDAALSQYPGKDRLVQLRTALVDSLPEVERSEMRLKDLEELRRLAQASEKANDPKELESIFAKTRLYSARYASDTEFLDPMTVIEGRVQRQREVPVPAAPPPAPPPEPDETQTAELANQGKMPGLLSRMSALFQTTAGKIAAAILLVVLLAVVYFGVRPITPAVTPPPSGPVSARVMLSDQTSGAKVLDSNERDVTGELPALGAGAYTIIDAKPGFAAVHQTFTVDPQQTREQTVPIVWHALPVPLVVQSTAGGAWTLDGKALTAEQLARTELSPGEHKLDWSEGAMQAELSLTVADGKVQLGAWQSKGGPIGVAVAVGRDGGEVRRLNVIRLKVQAGSEPPEETEADGPIRLPAAGSEMQLQAVREAAMLGKIPGSDASARAGLWVLLVTPHPIQRRKAEPPKPTVAPAPAPPPEPPPVAEPVKPKLTPEQEKEKFLREHGRSKEDIQGKAK